MMKFIKKQTLVFTACTLLAYPVLADNTVLGTNAGAALPNDSDSNVMVGANAGAASDRNKSTIVGANAGAQNVDVVASVLFGFNVMPSATASSYGTVLGTRASYNASSSYHLTLLGYQAAYNANGPDQALLVGSEAGFSISESSVQSTYIGYHSGYLQDGQYNTAVGSESLYGKSTDSTGSYNGAMGFRAGYGIGNGNYNIAMGEGAGFDLDAGSYNVLVGARAGERVQDNSVDLDNSLYYASTFVGTLAGLDSASGAEKNSFLGVGAGAANQTGDDNLVIGAFADFADWSAIDDSARETIFTAEINTDSGITPLATDASRVVLIGAASKASANDVVSIGYGSSVSASGAIAIGSGANASHVESIAIGYGAQSHGDYIAVLGNDSTTVWHPAATGVTALGDASYRFNSLHSQSLDIAAVSGEDLSITLAADAAEDNGDAWQWTVADGAAFSLSNNISGTQTELVSLTNGGDLTVSGDVNVLSDRNFKKDIAFIDNALSLVNQLKPKRYYWRAEAGRDQSQHLGLIAQEVQTILPEVVKTRADGYLAVNYTALLPLLAQAGGEIAAQHDQQTTKLNALAERLNAIEAAITESGKE